MNPIDTVLKVDWSPSTYIGDGVYVMRVDGDIALRTERQGIDEVIVLEPRMMAELNRFDHSTRGQQGAQRPKSTFVQVLPPTLGEDRIQDENETQGEIKINASVGLIPVGARLKHHTKWLEMLETHRIDGHPAHPLTISLPQEAVDQLNASGHTGNWVLTRVEGRTSVVTPEKTED